VQVYALWPLVFEAIRERRSVLSRFAQAFCERSRKKTLTPPLRLLSPHRCSHRLASCDRDKGSRESVPTVGRGQGVQVYALWPLASFLRTIPEKDIDPTASSSLTAQMFSVVYFIGYW
jgi:hypothetical protein